MVPSTDSRSLTSGYVGSCRAFFVFQVLTDHFPDPGVVTGVATGEAAAGGVATDFLFWSGFATAEIRRKEEELCGLI